MHFLFVLKYLFATVTKLSLLHVVEIGKKKEKEIFRGMF